MDKSIVLCDLNAEIGATQIFNFDKVSPTIMNNVKYNNSLMVIIYFKQGYVRKKCKLVKSLLVKTVQER